MEGGTRAKFSFRDVQGRVHDLILSKRQETQLSSLSKPGSMAHTASLSTESLGTFDEESVYKASRSGAYLAVHDADGTVHDLYLSTSQMPVISQTGTMKFNRSIFSSALNRFLEKHPPQQVNPIMRGSSAFVGPPIIDTTTPIMVKLKKETKMPGTAEGVVYETVWTTDGNFNAYVNGRSSMSSYEPKLGLPSKSLETFLERVKKSMRRSGKSLDLILDRTQLQFKKVEVAPLNYQHNPSVVYTTPQSKFSNMMNQSRALTTIARTVQRIIPFHEPPVLPANRIWDNRHSGTAATLLSEEKLKQIGTSCGEQAAADPIDPDKCVVALTTAELERLNDSSTDELQYVKPAYQVPPPSLAASEAGDEVEDDLYGADDEAVSTGKKLLEAGNQATAAELEADEQSVPFPNFFDNMSMSYEAILDRIRTARGLVATRKSASLMKPSDEEFATKYQSKDLRTIIVPYSGFYIMAPDGLQTVLDVDNNISEYYQLPLIDPMIDEVEFDVGSIGPRTSPFSPSNYDSSDDSHSDSSDSEENILQPPRSQPPSQAIIQYLTYKGQPLSSITSLLAPLDTCFLYHQTSRWFRTIRIPEHHELNDAMIAAVLEECKAEKQWWEEEVDKQGNVIPQELRILQGRMRERKVGHLARMSLENYFWWRLRGEMPHGMLPHGPLLREGGY